MIKFIFIGLFFSAGLLPASGYVAPKGPYEVTVVQGNLEHPKEHYRLEYRIYYPKSPGHYPVILHSHGYGGDREGQEYLVRYLSSWGFVCVTVSHEDEKNPKNMPKRIKDIYLVLDNLQFLSDSVAELKSKMNLNQVGLSGYSAGANMALLFAGAKYGRERNYTFTDKRLKAFVSMAPRGSDNQSVFEHAWDDIHVPVLVVTGGNDAGFEGQGTEWRRESYKRMPGGDKYSLRLPNADHRMIGHAEVGAGLQEGEFIKASCLYFWKAYLQGDSKMKTYLRSNAFKGQADLVWK